MAYGEDATPCWPTEYALTLWPNSVAVLDAVRMRILVNAAVGHHAYGENFRRVK